jgi:hypothetical protein
MNQNYPKYAQRRKSPSCLVLPANDAHDPSSIAWSRPLANFPMAILKTAVQQSANGRSELG